MVLGKPLNYVVLKLLRDDERISNVGLSRKESSIFSITPFAHRFDLIVSVSRQPDYARGAFQGNFVMARFGAYSVA